MAKVGIVMGSDSDMPIMSKAAIYHIDITDNITATWDSSKTEYKYTNEDFKNTGVEITCDIIGKDGFTYNWGINYGDPKVKGTKKPYWDRKYGRWQLNGGFKSGLETALSLAPYICEKVGIINDCPTLAYNESFSVNLCKY